MNTILLWVAVAGLPVTVLSALFAWRALYPPRRRLVVSFGRPVPLLASSGGRLPDLAVTVAGEPVTSPHVQTITVDSTGRHDVLNSQFDAGRPIVFDLGVPIVKVIRLHAASKTGERAEEPMTRTSRNELRLGPGPIPSGTRLTIELLTEGAPQPHMSERLSDTEVVQTAGFSGRSASTRKYWIVAGLMVGSAIAAQVAGVLTYLNQE
ncbi:hypothetical protein [Longispora albida]|uniref:hypothetical protein n=1 Tax=Longispora albida TaxID=203523 RepID=UPI000381878F|nr:hypothetical protein [Longispora albida]